MKIGLTGGIASGKSAAADEFARLGVTIVDTDRIAREVVAPGQAALAEIQETFGPSVISSDGTLDRRALRRRIFEDDVSRRDLEAILHPRIRELAVERALADTGDYVVIAVPLLVESPLREFVDRVLVIDCPEELQVERLRARDGATRQEAEKILAAQASRAARLAIADDVILNDSSLEALQATVRRIDQQYRVLASA